eukprot:XP_011616697.1 PREDICTED: metastasis-associated protein MTA1-like [Takifugu rubripes]
MLGKRSFHHHSRNEPERRSENPGTASGALLYNGRSSSSSGSTRGGVMIRKRRPNWIDAPDDSFFLVTRETQVSKDKIME